MSAGTGVRWVDRAVTVLITVLLGVAAQGLLSWREITVLSTGLQTEIDQRQRVDANTLEQLDETADQLQDTARLVIQLEQKLESTQERVTDHVRDGRAHK